jgi:hypothetical protein
MRVSIRRAIAPPPAVSIHADARKMIRCRIEKRHAA